MNGKPGNDVLVIFGASGDLTRRKIFPALFRLAAAANHSTGLSVIGYARTEKSDEAFRAELRSAVVEAGAVKPGREAALDALLARTRYVHGEYGDAGRYAEVARRIGEIEADSAHEAPGVPPGDRIFYLATPPSGFVPILDALRVSGLSAAPPTGGIARVVVEKPFGHDLASARALNASLASAFHERNAFRIDHYLGKETVQNLLVFRFANGIFEPIWNHRYIAAVEITVAETLGVEGRGGYFEQAGILRDMIQNHVLQILTLVAMEPPGTMSADAIRNEKVKVLYALRPFTTERVDAETVRGQYAPGLIGGKPVAGYVEEPGVSPTSRTETYAALRVLIDNWRWSDVPFYIRSGKRLGKRMSEVAITFKEMPSILWNRNREHPVPRNVLVLRIQPDEGVTLTIGAKSPGVETRVAPVKMDFSYQTAFGVPSADAYERLLLDALQGDSTLFIRNDEVEAAWTFVDPILARWAEATEPIPTYEAGSSGPREADRLAWCTGHEFRKL